MPLQSRPITAMWANMELGLAGWMAGDAGGPSETSGGRGSGNDLPVMPGPEKPLLWGKCRFPEIF